MTDTLTRAEFRGFMGGVLSRANERASEAADVLSSMSSDAFAQAQAGLTSLSERLDGVELPTLQLPEGVKSWWANLEARVVQSGSEKEGEAGDGGKENAEEGGGGGGGGGATECVVMAGAAVVKVVGVTDVV